MAMGPAALLPPLLPTPPRSQMLPLLPTPSGVTLLLAVSTMPGRADFVQKWDEYKKDKMPCSPTSSSSSSSDNGGSSSRADPVKRWDVHKKYKIPGSSTSSSSSDSGWITRRADSVKRWDTKKLKTPSRTSPPTDRGGLQDNNNNKRPSSRASSADRWDLHKKHCPEEKDILRQTNETTAAAHKEMARMQQAAFAGANFYASPEPTMLPMPSFLLRAH